jgi:uncharacterized DUF497 family protein
MERLVFEWDAKKARANRRRHRVDFSEATTVFSDPLSVTVPDPDNPSGEERFVIIGEA